MSGLVAWVNGELVPAEEATISVFDRGFRSGEGVFETLRAYGGHPFRLDAHVRRAVAGAAELGFALDAPTLVRACLATAARNLEPLGGADSVLRLTASAGTIDPDSAFPGAPIDDPTVVVTSHRLALAPRIHERGITAASVPIVREMPHVKAVSYAAALAAGRRARQLGADEALLTTDDGRVLEAATANVFAVQGSRLVTPPSTEGLLAGITRQVVLDVAASLGIEVQRQPLPIEVLCDADEAFLTATTREVVPLVQVDGAAIGDGRPGPVTRQVLDGYRAEVERERRAAGLTAG